MVVVKNTETIGLWVEMLLCKIHKIQFNTTRSYINDLKFDIEGELTNCLTNATKNLKLIEHTGSKNNAYDFLMDRDLGVSIKTNISNDKCCPPKVGQTTLSKMNFTDNNQFKRWVMEDPGKTFEFYSNAMFEAEHTVYVNFTSGEVYTISKQDVKHIDKGRFTFTRTIETWNESCSMKLDGKTIAEFQIHNNRNAIKCRLVMGRLLELCNASKYTFKKINFKVAKNIGTFNYIGSKTKLLPFLKENIEKYICKNISEISSFYDLFAGTGAVSSYFIENGCKNVITNDNMYYSYLLCSCFTNTNIDVEKVSKFIDILNGLPAIQGYISETYSNGRMYFTPKNAAKIDSIRTHIEGNKGIFTIQEYNLLLKILLYSSSKVANISSTYGAYLKKYKKSATACLKMEKTAVNSLYTESTVSSYNTDILNFVSFYDTVGGEVCYLDPPYNSRKYSSNYFVIEAIAKYDKSPVSNGVTGVPLVETPGSGSFCSKTKAMESFNVIFGKIKTKYLFMSYNSESLLSKEDVVSLLEANGWVDVIAIEEEYKRFKSNSSTNQEEPLKEYLFCAKQSERI